ncbi:MAG TPA: sigma-70 family RNA polymerase sigma factor [Candidatus Limivivens merdigallinarum]|uniref:Sigma-70 family RNA polymerase sigma factor n=1 Tax=Candidatus Limivivens merdigallinarum TaxID=2840859 RepID=A0A9D1D1Y0_9FIRM|nr:sigma-70 family RNA polymerase sigma factor [Candidatus Limivivens merdigallinarum]
MELQKELVWRARQGDAKAFAELYRGIYQDLYRFALYTLKHSQDAEDAVGDAVMDAWKGIRKLKNEEAFRSWIFRILACKCRRKLKSYRNREIELTEDLESQDREIGEDLDVREAFFRLSGEERMILALNLFAGYSSREIGTFLEEKDSTVRSKQRRALRKMRTWLGD